MQRGYIFDFVYEEYDGKPLNKVHRSYEKRLSPEIISAFKPIDPGIVKITMNVNEISDVSSRASAQYYIDLGVIVINKAALEHYSLLFDQNGIPPRLDTLKGRHDRFMQSTFINEELHYAIDYLFRPEDLVLPEFFNRNRQAREMLGLMGFNETPTNLQIEEFLSDSFSSQIELRQILRVFTLSMYIGTEKQIGSYEFTIKFVIYQICRLFLQKNNAAQILEKERVKTPQELIKKYFENSHQKNPETRYQDARSVLDIMEITVDDLTVIAQEYKRWGDIMLKEIVKNM